MKRSAKKVSRAVSQVSRTVDPPAEQPASSPPRRTSPRAPEGFKRGPGGELYPVPRPHPPEPADRRAEWPDSAPQSGPDVGGPIAEVLRKGFDLPFFGLLGDGESTSLEGGCSGTSAEPAKCFGQTVGDDGKTSTKRGRARDPHRPRSRRAR